jgi:5-methylcytosine-specific restriction endonuclease McrA
MTNLRSRDQLMLESHPPDTIACVHCERFLAPDAFRPNSSFYGRHSWCRECSVAATRSSRNRHRDRINDDRRVDYRANADAEREAARRRWRATHPFPERTCPACSTSFMPARGNQVYCSPEHRASERSDRRPTKPPQAVRRRVLDRDGWTCYLCSRPIALALRWPHPLSGTVDHVIPVSAGGSDREDNLHAAHWACNEAKGDQLPGIEVWIPGGLVA